jgi:predicted RNase H-like nuclease
MRHNKRTPAGRQERLDLLATHDPASAAFVHALLTRHPRRLLAPDDAADAAILALSASLASARGTRLLPESPERDSLGLPMQMLFAHL